MAKKDSNAIGFAVVGLGMGKHHCRSILQARGAELIAVCDDNSQRLRQVTEQFQVPGYATVDGLLGNRDVEVVNVAVPTGLHAEIGIWAARAGRHVLCEKPLDVNLEKANALIRACREAGVKLGAIFQRRLHPLSKLIKRTIDDGRLGPIHYADVHLYWYRTQDYYAGGSPPGWRGTWALDGGGACMNQGIHSIDLLQWLVGPVRQVYAKTGTFTHDIEAEDVGTALLTFANGALGNITCATSAYPGLTNDLHIFGRTGSIVLSDDRVVTWRIQHPDGQEAERTEEKEMMARYSGSETTPSADPMAVGFDGHIIHVEDMVQAIREDRDPIIPGEEARHAIEIAVAIQQSSQTGREIVLGDGA